MYDSLKGELLIRSWEFKGYFEYYAILRIKKGLHHQHQRNKCTLPVGLSHYTSPHNQSATGRYEKTIV